MPCDRCLEIVSHTINRDESRAKIPQWQTDTWGLVESAKTCECCQILWNLFMKPELVSGKGRYRVDLVNSRLPIKLNIPIIVTHVFGLSAELRHLSL
ncbi:hypothetical protein CGCF413_v000306 [Colletotrichum fructicola]|nr:hypothetical protein CGCF413_v000306 [Colletotrichum fructicola]